MPKLPSVLDYGQRPSLQSNRLDRPDQSGLMMAEELATAARTFSQLAGEKKAKDDRLNYSLAKNELLQADIAARQSLEDREDFKKFDEDYFNGYQQRASEVFTKYGLSPSDRALLGAESDLIRTRGRVYAGELARQKRLDWQRGELLSSLDAAMEEVMVAPPDLQADLLNTQLEAITAAINEGVLGDEEGKKMSQGFVKTVATGALEKMDAEDRIKELELSLAHRDARGAISPEELAQGGGTGSIADYLHADVAKKMLEDAKTENEIDTKQATAFDALDQAWDQFPEFRSSTEREKYISDLLRDYPDARKEALILERQRTSSRASADSMRRGEQLMELLNDIEMGGLTYHELDPNKLKNITEPERRQLERASQLHHEGDGFSDYTTWESQTTWDNMTPEQKAATDLNGLMPVDPANPGGDRVLWRNVTTRERMNLMSAQKSQLEARIAAGTTAQDPGTLTDQQFLTEYLTKTPYFDRKPVSGDSKQLKDRWARISTAWDAAVLAEGEKTGGKVSETRRREILGEIMYNEVFVREWGTDPKFPAIAIAPDQMEEAYIPINQEILINGKTGTVRDMWMVVPEEHGGGDQLAYEWIVNTYKSVNNTTKNPDPEEIEEIWYYLATQGFDAAKARIRGDKGY